jgi:hypothetical protein
LRASTTSTMGAAAVDSAPVRGFLHLLGVAIDF